MYEINNPTANTGFVGVFLVFYLIMYSALTAYYVIAYIFQSKGMYGVAKRRGINNPWLAWIPFASLWLLGKIADDYCEKAEGKITNYRKKLLGSAIAMAAVVFSWSIYYFVGMVLSGLNRTNVFMTGGPFIAITVLIFLLMTAVCIVTYVFQYIAIYKYFMSCQPSRAVLYLLLSIFIGVPQPFFMYSAGKYDEGMPKEEVIE